MGGLQGQHFRSKPEFCPQELNSQKSTKRRLKKKGVSNWSTHSYRDFYEIMIIESNTSYTV